MRKGDVNVEVMNYVLGDTELFSSSTIPANLSSRWLKVYLKIFSNNGVGVDESVSKAFNDMSIVLDKKGIEIQYNKCKQVLLKKYRK